MPPALPNDAVFANHLMSVLPPAERAQILPYLHLIKLDQGDVIEQGAGDFGYAYFPTTCVVSLTCDMEDGASTQVAITGNDGLLGTSVILGGTSAPSRAIVGISGYALRIEASSLRNLFQRGGIFQRVLLRYTDAMIAQISLTAACNRKHTLEKRFCRWLLLIRDRALSDDLTLTQEFIANMLGGRRESVNIAAGRLQDAGLISNTRGHLRILNRKGLEMAACECYAPLMREECSRMPPQPTMHHAGWPRSNEAAGHRHGFK